MFDFILANKDTAIFFGVVMVLFLRGFRDDTPPRFWDLLGGITVSAGCSFVITLVVYLALWKQLLLREIGVGRLFIFLKTCLVILIFGAVVAIPRKNNGIVKVLKGLGTWLGQLAVNLTARASTVKRERERAVSELKQAEERLLLLKNDPYFELAMRELDRITPSEVLEAAEVDAKLKAGAGAVPKEVLRQARSLAAELRTR